MRFYKLNNNTHLYNKLEYILNQILLTKNNNKDEIKKDNCNVERTGSPVPHIV